VFRFDSANLGSKTTAQFQFKPNSIIMPISKENHISIFLYSNDDGVVEVYDISNSLPWINKNNNNNNNIESHHESRNLFAAHTIPNLCDQKSPLECTLQSMFQIGNAKWSKGWKFKLFCINNNSYCICYKPETGRASFDCFETINGFEFLRHQTTSPLLYYYYYADDGDDGGDDDGDDDSGDGDDGDDDSGDGEDEDGNYYHQSAMINSDSNNRINALRQVSISAY
jgi:hypothetical protein